MSRWEWGRPVGPIDVAIVATADPDTYRMGIEVERKARVVSLRVPWIHVSLAHRPYWFLPKAGGAYLTMLGQHWGVSRETDQEYRARLLAYLDGTRAPWKRRPPCA